MFWGVFSVDLRKDTIISFTVCFSGQFCKNMVIKSNYRSIGLQINKNNGKIHARMTNQAGKYIQNLDMTQVDTIAYDYLGSHPHLYPIPEFASMSHVKTTKPWSWPEHVHPNHEWILIKKGEDTLLDRQTGICGRSWRFLFHSARTNSSGCQYFQAA